MASKVEKAKADQGYTMDSPICGNCAHYTSEMMLPAWMQKRNKQDRELGVAESFSDKHATDEKNKRCMLGNFTVKKTAWCKRWEAKV